MPDKPAVAFSTSSTRILGNAQSDAMLWRCCQRRKASTAKPKGNKDPKNPAARYRWRQHFTAVLATLSTMSLGYVDGWSSNALPILQAASNWTMEANSSNWTGAAVPAPEERPLTDDEASWLGSLVALGAMTGALPAGLIADALGRKPALLLLTLPFIGSWGVILFAGRSVPLLYTARLLAGYAMGSACVITPLYNEEISEVCIRGALGVYQNLMVTAGILVSYIAGATLSYDGTLYVGCLPPVLLLLLFSWAPESPVLLVAKGKEERAKKALRWFRGPHADVDAEINKIKELVSEAASRDGEVKTILDSVKALLRRMAQARHDIRSLVIVFGLMCFRQIIGINAIVFYTVDIFQAAQANLSPSAETIIVGIVQVISTVISSRLVDRAGRRTMLLVSATGTAVCHSVLFTYFLLGQTLGWDLKDISWLPLLALTLFMVVFAAGFGPLPWLMIAELLPSQHKRWAAGVAGLLNWLGMFTVTRSFGLVQSRVGVAGCFGGFMMSSLLAAAFVYFLVPETAKKTLQEIQAELRNRKKKQQSPENGIITILPPTKEFPDMLSLGRFKYLPPEEMHM